MSHLLWKYFWENDVDKFRRLLAPAGNSSHPLSKSPGIAHGSLTLSPVALGVSPRSSNKPRRVSGYSGSSGKSKDSGFGLGRNEINSRDHAGLTILLRAASSTSPDAKLFVQALLEHPSIDIHVQDPESGWNALHRALYAGNVAIARMLLDQEYLDMMNHGTGTFSKVGQLIKTKDNEGKSPFDLYNSTIAIRSANPNERPDHSDSDSESESYDAPGEKMHLYHASQVSHDFHSPTEADELFVFGSNKNLSLGVGDEDDRQYPERIQLRRPDQLVHMFHQSYLDDHDMVSNASLPDWEDVPNMIRSRPLVIRDVVMSKLHSAILTTDPVSNLYVCGVGRGGRLGLGDENTQFRYVPVLGPLADKHVQHVALGQNHSLAVTANGELWTWGLNTESQLGYVLPPPLRAEEEPMSLVPRQVFGTLKKEIVLGAAASVKHSVCHTGSSLYCWGRNLGQLALMDADSRSLDVQVSPRKVAASLLSAPIEMVSAIERATIVLLANKSVLIFTNYGYNLVKFPLPDTFSNLGLATSFNPYDPKRREIRYIASGGETIAAVTSRGDLFTMELSKTDFNQPGSSTTNPVKIKGAVTAPRCIWDSRKDGVVSVDVGENGSVIICTESGAAWRRVKRVRGKNAAFADSPDVKRRDFKFERIPYITNCVSVRSSVFGAFAAIRKDAKAVTEAIKVSEQNLWDHLAPLLHLTGFTASETSEGEKSGRKAWDAAIVRDTADTVCLQILKSPNIERDLLDWLRVNPQLEETDMLICAASTPEIRIPVHSWILAGRSSILRNAFSEFRRRGSVPAMEGVSLGLVGEKLLLSLQVDVYTLLNILVFTHLDTIVPVWRYTKEAPVLAFRFRQVRSELMKFATRLNMPKLEAAARLQNGVERSLDADFHQALAEESFLEGGDVVLQLEGEDVLAHSQLLYQRCPFFEGMFFGRSQGQWLAARKGGTETREKMKIDLKHIRPEIFQFVLTYLYADVGVDMFDQHAEASLDDFSELVVDVMAVANELMLDRLSEICQHTIGKFVNARNIANLLNEIGPCSVSTFKDAGLEYICVQLETMLENRLLDNLDEDLLQDLDEVVRANQLARSPLARSGEAEIVLYEKYPDLLLDIDEERQRRVREMAFKCNQREEEKKASHNSKGRSESFEELSATHTPERTRRRSRGTRNEPFSPVLRPKTSQADMIFDMDEEHTSGSPTPFSPTPDTTAPQLDETNVGLSSIPSPWQTPKGRCAVEPSKTSLVGTAGSELTPSTPALDSARMMTSISPGSPAARPWASTPLQTTKLDLRDIMSEATSSTSALSAQLAFHNKKEPSAGRAATVKMSQKEKKKQMQLQAEAQAAAEKEQTSQAAWEKATAGSKPAPWKTAPESLPKHSPQDARSAEVASAASAIKVKPLVASESRPHTTQRRTASPDTRFSGQSRVQSSPAASGAPSSFKQKENKPVIPHSKSYMQPKAKAEPTIGYSMADIIGQQQREQEMVKEAVAKRSLQEIQQEQAFQEWWDQESRRAQEEEARRQSKQDIKGDKNIKGNSKRGRGSKPKDVAQNDDAVKNNASKSTSHRGAVGERGARSEGRRRSNKGGASEPSSKGESGVRGNFRVSCLHRL